MKRQQLGIGRQKGFTIVELMIATSILSTLLLLMTVMMINIGRLYYKGVSSSQVQDDVRTITDQVSQYLELSNSSPIQETSGSEHAYCLDSVRFTYVLYQQIGTQAGQSPHVLWRDTNPTPGTCSNLNLPDLTQSTPSPGGTELIAPNSRLTNFSISTTSPYNVSVAVAYGDSDLLCDNGFTAPDDCTYFAGISAHMGLIISNTINPTGQIVCKNVTGGQFCATSDLTTTVAQRLTP